MFSGDWVITVSGQHVAPTDNTLRVWGLDGIEAARIPLEGYGQQVVMLGEEHALVHTITSTGLALYRLDDGERIWMTTEAEYCNIGPIALSLDHTRLYAFTSMLGESGEAGFRLLDPWTGQEQNSWPSAKPWKSGHCFGMAIHPQSGHIFASLGDNSSEDTNHVVIRRLDPATGEWTASYGAAKQTLQVAISPNGRWLGSPLGKQVAVWDLSKQL